MRSTPRRGARPGLAAAVVAAAAALAGCAGPPWFLGEPIDGRPSINPNSARLTIQSWHNLARARRAAGQVVLELEALSKIDEARRLTDVEHERLAVLLERRAAEFHARGRAIPESRDLRLLERLAPERAEALAGYRAWAERAAGDAWLAIGALDRASEAYRSAAALGAPDTTFRLRAAAGAPPPPETPLAELKAAVAALPLRAVPSEALAYLERGGDDRATLARGLAAARQERMPALVIRLQNGLTLLPAPAEAPAPGPAAPAPPSPPATPPALPPDLDDWVTGGPTLSARLLPLAAAHPDILQGRRALRWADLLLAEDPTSPEVLATVATIFGRARRFGGTERMLLELAYYTPDRAAGLARGAAVWEALGRGREACAQWIRASRWRDEAEDPNWRRAIACARRDPGAGDWRAIRKYVLDLAPAERREQLAAALDQP